MLKIYQKKRMSKRGNVNADQVVALLATMVEAMQEKKAKNILSIDLQTVNASLCSYFLVCSAQSTTQVDSIASFLEKHVEETWGERAWRKDGYENSLWIVLDYGDIMVHVFQDESRDYYRLEDLWGDAKIVRYESEQ